MRQYLVKKYYKKCIEAITASKKTDDIEEHILKHANELATSNRNKVSWSASMRNLLDIYDSKYNIPSNYDLQIRKMEEHHHKYPERRTALPGKRVPFYVKKDTVPKFDE